MERCNIFNNIHKGLRAMLFQTAALLQQTDFSSGEETTAALEQAGAAIDLFNKYTALEKPVVHAAIFKSTADFVIVIAESEMERAVIAQRIKLLSGKLSTASLSANQHSNGELVQRAFNAFMTCALRYMALEEGEVNKVLWLSYSDAALHSIKQQMLGVLPAESLEQYNRWMLRGLNNEEISCWLKETKNTAPDVIFTTLVDMAAEELNEHRWQLIRDAITDGAQLA